MKYKLLSREAKIEFNKGLINRGNVILSMPYVLLLTIPILPLVRQGMEHLSYIELLLELTSKYFFSFMFYIALSLALGSSVRNHGLKQLTELTKDQ